MANDLHNAREQAIAFSAQHVAELSREINEWQDTDLLASGRLHELAELVRPFAGLHNLQLAESFANRAARDFSATTPTAPPDRDAMGRLVVEASGGVSLPPMSCSRSNRSDCALFGSEDAPVKLQRPSREWYAAKIAETLDDDFVIGSDAVTDTERLAFLHGTNSDAEGWEYGVCKAIFGPDGKVAAMLWTASDHSDIDALIIEQRDHEHQSVAQRHEELQALEREHVGDPDKKTGIYASREEAPAPQHIGYLCVNKNWAHRAWPQDAEFVPLSEWEENHAYTRVEKVYTLTAAQPADGKGEGA